MVAYMTFDERRKFQECETKNFCTVQDHLVLVLIWTSVNVGRDARP